LFRLQQSEGSDAGVMRTGVALPGAAGEGSDKSSAASDVQLQFVSGDGDACTSCA